MAQSQDDYLEQFMAEYRQQEHARLETARDTLEAGMIPRLEKRGVARVKAEYSGCGDSGCIHHIACTDAQGQSVNMDLVRAASDPEIARVFCDLLPDGFEINEGGQGDVTIDVAAATARREHRENVTETRDSPGSSPSVAHPQHHAVSSAKKFGGKPDEHLRLHAWLGVSKQGLADLRHRAPRHSSKGIFMVETLFDATIKLSTGRVLPVRFMCEPHVLEDLGRIRTAADLLGRIQPERWMLGRETGGRSASGGGRRLWPSSPALLPHRGPDPDPRPTAACGSFHHRAIIPPLLGGGVKNRSAGPSHDASGRIDATCL